MNDDGIFMPMINDTGRNQFYKAAIQQAVQGKTVVDIGTCTGLLSILAAKAGADKVFAVEQDPSRAELARTMFANLNLLDKIEVVEDNFLNTDIAADIYVSETINTQIFGEGILQLADHALKYGGEFIPGQFKLTAALYQNHPIFVLCQARSDAFEFQPDIDIDPEFESAINSSFQQAHPLADSLYRANILNGLFTQLPKFTDLKLTKLSESESIMVDLNQPVNLDNLKLTIPKSSENIGQDVYVVLFWQAIYRNTVMNVNQTWFGNVSKTILSRCRNPNVDITMWYDPTIQDWRFAF